MNYLIKNEKTEISIRLSDTNEYNISYQNYHNHFQYFCCLQEKHKNVSYEKSQLSFKGKTNDMKLRLRTHIIFALKDDSTALI